jgi:DNA-binding MarR family transcriptional regulator
MKQNPTHPAESRHFTMSLIHAAQGITQQLEEAVGEAGLSMAKFSAISALAAAGEPLTLGELADRLSCVRSNITQLVDRLESDGLVRRLADPSDRRSIRAELTALGVEKHAAGQEALGRAQHEIASRISAADLIGLQSALGALG